MINLEHVAAVRTKYWGYEMRKTTAVSPMRWWVWGSPKLLDIALKSFARFNVAVTADMDPGASGEMGSIARDAPSMQVITSPEVKHTEQDTEEWVPAVGPRADRARLREDHRRGEQAGSQGRCLPGCDRSERLFRGAGQVACPRRSTGNDQTMTVTVQRAGFSRRQPSRS